MTTTNADTAADPFSTEKMADLFRVLGHNTRLRLVQLLATGEYAVSAIERETGIQQPALSQQLAILRKARLIIPRRQARLVYYRLDKETLARSAHWLALLCSVDERVRR